MDSPGCKHPVADNELPEDEVDSTGEGGRPLEIDVLVDGVMEPGDMDVEGRMHPTHELREAVIGCQKYV